MLVVTRKPGDTILIGDNIEVVILEFKRDWIRIGITAPKEIRIMRGDAKRWEKPPQPGPAKPDDNKAQDSGPDESREKEYNT